MNRVAFTIGQSLLLLIFFVIDKSSIGVFRPFDYFSLTILYLMVLLQLNSSRSFLTAFFLFGFLVDWYNKSFLGMSSLFAIIIAFIYNLILRRFAGNRATMFALNAITAYLLFEVWIGFREFFSVKALVFTGITMVLTAVMWLKE
jgi:cell shape-determining protein MreD